MNGFRAGELFGDGAGGAEAIGLAMAVSTSAATNPVYVDGFCDLVLSVATAGTVADEIRFEIEESFDGGTTWAIRQIGYGFDENGVRMHTDGVYRQINVGPELWTVRVDPGCMIRLLALRVGGGVDTTLLITGQAREPLGSEQPGVPLHDVFLTDFTDYCFSTAAGAVLAVGAGPGWTDTLGDEWHASGTLCNGALLAELAVAGGETAIQARVLERVAEDAGAVEYQPQATNSVVGGVEDVDGHVIDLQVTAGNVSSEFNAKPGCEYKVQLRRTGGGPTARARFLFWR